MKKILFMTLTAALLLSLLVSCLPLSKQSETPTDSRPATEEPEATETNASDISETAHTYGSFTSAEKRAFTELFGEVIPFVSNSDYYVEDYDDGEFVGLNYYTYGNTAAEFAAYRKTFSAYTFLESYQDEDGDLWYAYQKGDVYVDLAFYESENGPCIDVYVYYVIGTVETTPNGDTEGYTYTAFTAAETRMFTELFGEVIPFVANDSYYVEDYAAEDLTGLNFYTFGNTASEFEAYLAAFSAYTYLETYEDEEGDAWYIFQKDDYYVELGYYLAEGGACIDVYVYFWTEAGETTPGGSTTDGYTYTAFTAAEAQKFTELFGEVIPFVANDSYYVEDYAAEDLTGLNFYTFGNTQAEYNAYFASFTEYQQIGSYYDEYGDVWYVLQKGETYVDISFYDTGEGSCIDVYIYVLTEAGETTPGGSTTDGYTYTAFTAAEAQKFTELFGEVIPFVANNSYYVEEYSFEDESGLNFYTFGNTQAEYNAYFASFTEYQQIDSYYDEYGDVWYVLQKGETYVDISFYDTGEGSCIDVYIYVLTEAGETTPGGSWGGGEAVDLITNSGAGLPASTDGVYDVDFTDATYVQNVTEQGYYLDGCPTVGAPGVLVIPVDFRDVPAESRGYDLSVIENAFVKGGSTDYQSVYDYYALSSYGQLELNITVLDFWFRPENTSTYYENATMNYGGSQVAIGDQLILDEALAYLEPLMDLSAFDSDNNGTIDAVVLINSLDIGDADFHWAYRYWNLYTDDADEWYVYDGVSANDYIWASYQFLNQGFDRFGNVAYDDTDAVNTYTYIHEFGHILGADDYYDTAGIGSPMGDCDVMDSMAGDHNAYSKFNYGWLTSSRLVTTDTSVTLTLRDFSESGDTVIIANNWDPALGVYQEYYIVAYYRSVGLNSGAGGYFERDGIVVYHVNASLFAEVYGGVTYYDVYYNNTHASDEYGTEENLIEYVLSEAGTYTYEVGDRLPAVSDDSGNRLMYTLTVDALSEDAATVTFTRAA